MSNYAIAVIVIGVALTFVILGAKGVQRSLLIVGLLAIALLVFLIWAGVISLADIKDSIFTKARDLRSGVELEEVQDRKELDWRAHDLQMDTRFC